MPFTDKDGRLTKAFQMEKLTLQVNCWKNSRTDKLINSVLFSGSPAVAVIADRTAYDRTVAPKLANYQNGFG